MASSSGEVVIVPRNFVLLEELEKAEQHMLSMVEAEAAFLLL